MLAQPALFDRSMTNYWAGVSGKGNKLFQDGGQIKREKRTYITTVRDLYLSFATLPTPLVSHWSLPFMCSRLLTVNYSVKNYFSLSP
jgi:hypothetical protein